jgi:hypothetical protein
LPADRPEPVDAALLAAALGVDADDPPDALVRAARLANWALPVLVLSVLARDGAPLGIGAADELRRARDRAATYADLRAAVPALRVLKGASLARHYPAPLVRPVGDLDLVAAGEADLWQAVRTITDRVPVQHIDVSLFGTDSRHIAVTLTWPAEDPLLDREYAVDLSTAAYAGDLRAVPPRAAAPADPVLADLLALAEERFQRPYGAKDAVDVLLVGAAALPPDEVIIECVSRYRLAPEVTELLDYAATLRPAGRWAAVRAGLAGPAEREQARRRGGPDRAGVGTAEMTGPVDPVQARLAAGQPAYGMLLRRIPWRTGMAVSRTEQFAAGWLLRTPVADYVLVASETVPLELYERALAALGPTADGGR